MTTDDQQPVSDLAPSWISVADLAGGAAGRPLLDESGSIHDPLLIVDLGDAPEPEAAAAAAAATDRILVGVHSGSGTPVSALLAAMDVTLTASAAADRRESVITADPEGDAAALQATARRNPAAAIVLAGLLRSSGALDVAAALDAESFAYSTLLGGPEFAVWLRARGPRPVPPPPDAAPVLVRRHNGVLHVTLNRPRRRNAYGRDVRDALVEALQIAVHDPHLAVVLDGAGPAFCSGGDLDEFGTTPDLVTAHLVRTRGGAGLPLHHLAARTLVQLHGPCVGAGVELPAFAGHVRADPEATMWLPEVGMGLIPGAGGTVSLPRRIGRWRTLYMALSGVALDARTALGWGLVDEIGG